MKIETARFSHTQLGAAVWPGVVPSVVAGVRHGGRYGSIGSVRRVRVVNSKDQSYPFFILEK